MSEACQESDCCPICLEEAGDQNSSQFLVSPHCGHAACRSCWEDLLVTDKTKAFICPGDKEKNPHYIPMLGICPLCRSPVYRFHLLDQTTRQPVYKSDCQLSASEICDSLKDAVYEYDGIGRGSWHFDATANSIYFNVAESERLLPGRKKRSKLESVCFHEPTRTLTGTLKIDKEPYKYWNVYLCFSSDYGFIRTGLIHKAKRQILDSERTRKLFPLDGVWEVETKELIQIENMKTSSGTSIYGIRGRVGFFKYEESGGVVMTAEWDLRERPLGPVVGECLVWKERNVASTTEHSRRSTWKRMNVAVLAPPDDYMQFGNSVGFIYRRHQRSPREPPTYNRESLWGNVFCQQFKVGLASYHFLTPEKGVYMSYEHPATGDWPCLDNGTPVPSQVHFHDVHVNGTTFRGRILWEQDYGATWHNMSEWVYEMEFDIKFLSIIGGRVMCREVGNSSLVERSEYGEHLVYVNASLFPWYNAFLQENRSTEAIMLELLPSMSWGGSVVPPRTHRMVHLVLETAVQGLDNPIDWNL